MAILAISGKINSGKDLIGNIIQYLTSTTGYEFFSFEEWTNYNSGFNDSQWEIKKFAGKLKDIICLLIGCSREQLEDKDFKEKELGEKWNNYYLYRQERIYTRHLTKEDAISKYEHRLFRHREDTKENFEIKEKSLTPRLLMQLLGTECGRDIIHPNLWCNSLFADYKSNVSYRFGMLDLSKKGSFKQIGDTVEDADGFPNWVITDLRFPNEAQAIKDKGGITIRVNRYTNNTLIDNDTHVVTDWQHPSETALDNYKFDYVIDNNGSIEDLIDKVREIMIKEKLL